MGHSVKGSLSTRCSFLCFVFPNKEDTPLNSRLSHIHIQNCQYREDSVSEIVRKSRDCQIFVASLIHYCRSEFMNAFGTDNKFRSIFRIEFLSVYLTQDKV